MATKNGIHVPINMVDFLIPVSTLCFWCSESAYVIADLREYLFVAIAKAVNPEHLHRTLLSAGASSGVELTQHQGVVSAVSVPQTGISLNENKGVQRPMMVNVEKLHRKQMMPLQLSH